MLYQLAVAIGGVFVLLAGWVAVEQWVRRKSPRVPGDCGEAIRAHGCHHCIMADTCTQKPEDDEPES